MFDGVVLRRRLCVLVAGVVLGSGLVAATAPAGAAVIRPDTHCRNGTASITFDDGPSPAHTPRLLRILRAHRAQATFFVQGVNATRHPEIVRRMVRDGHAVADHSWDHPDLRTRSNRSVKRQLKLTQDAIHDITGRQPAFYRPPYGSTDDRVRRLARHYGLREMLWTIDSRDWAGGSAKQIRKAALRGLRRHRSNVILMHDAVTNSPRTLKAVPGVIRGIRARGYCLVPLQQMMPFDTVAARAVRVNEGTRRSRLVTVTFRLSGPSQRNGSFRVMSQGDSAVPGDDYLAVDRVVPVRRGARSVSIQLRVRSDPMPDTDRRLLLLLDRPHGVAIATDRVPVTITDNRAWSERVDALVLPPDVGPDVGSTHEP